MSEKVACRSCKILILPDTAQRTGGVCMPCMNGTRESMEAARDAHAREREKERTCPFRQLWRELIDKAYGTPDGFDRLSDDEKHYFAVQSLIGEVYNGGFDQYFHNSSGDTYRFAELGLIRMGATHSIALLRSAKSRLFGKAMVPREQEERWSILRNLDSDDLDDLDKAFYDDSDRLDDRLEAFARETRLVKLG